MAIDATILSNVSPSLSILLPANIVINVRRVTIPTKPPRTTAPFKISDSSIPAIIFRVIARMRKDAAILIRTLPSSFTVLSEFSAESFPYMAITATIPDARISIAPTAVPIMFASIVDTNFIATATRSKDPASPRRATATAPN